MPPGKLAAQSGHAFLEAHLRSTVQRPAIARDYAELRPGTKVVLVAPCLDAIQWAEDQCFRLEIPHALVVDQGHVLPPHFDGGPIITGLGFGPARRAEVRLLTRRFALAA